MEEAGLAHAPIAVDAKHLRRRARSDRVADFVNQGVPVKGVQ